MNANAKGKQRLHIKQSREISGESVDDGTEVSNTGNRLSERIQIKSKKLIGFVAKDGKKKQSLTASTHSVKIK